MPLHRSVKFEMQSVDVIHSLWIPQMGQKQDVVPGITTSIVITPTYTSSTSSGGSSPRSASRASTSRP